jgi:hypothetical protein
MRAEWTSEESVELLRLHEIHRHGINMWRTIRGYNSTDPTIETLIRWSKEETAQLVILQETFINKMNMWKMMWKHKREMNHMISTMKDNHRKVNKRRREEDGEPSQNQRTKEELEEENASMTETETSMETDTESETEADTELVTESETESSNVEFNSARVEKLQSTGGKPPQTSHFGF